MKKLFLTIGLAVTVLAFGARAAAVPPNPVSAILTYQGAIYVDNEPFNGTGLFKLVIVNESGDSLWSNDESSSSGSEPNGDVAVALDQGFFDVLLGDTSIPGMAEMNPAIFTADEKLYLRTWFSDGEHGFEEMTPAIQLTTSTFAINSQFLRGYSPDDFFLNSSQITSSQIAAGAVTSTAIAGGAVGTTQIADNSITGNKITAFSNNNTNFTVGRGVDETVIITAGTGAASDPGLRYDATTDKWQYSNDGATWNDIGSGGGSGTVNAGGANELAYYAAAGTTVSGLTTGNNGVLVTDGSGVPSISSQLPDAVMDNITRVGTVTSGTWQGNAIADAYVANDLTIDGGNIVNTPINNSAIGGTTPADGTFRNLTAELDAVLEADAQVRGGDLTVGLGTTAYAGRVVLHDADAGDSFTTTIQSNANVPASFSLILPADDGDPNEVLTTDGSGNLSWSAAASGDVTGPGSSTDNALPRFDGAGGKTLQNSGVIVDDTNNVSGVAALSIDSMGKDWTNAGRTIADLGAVTTVDINGGDIDGVDIGLNTAGKGTFTDIVASTFLLGTSNQGDILYDNGTSFVRLTPGTSGQFLQTQGAGANPTWATAAGGDVTGPGSSSDNAITRFDGTTGKLVQDSNVIVSDGGSVNIPAGQSFMINSAALDQDDIGDGATYKQYNPASVAITGGTVDNASVGATTASTGRFTTVESTVATGTAPLTVASTTLVTNLNADLLDGQSGSYYNDLANAIIASQAQGDILYFDGANWARLGAGTAGQVLQTQGAGANPQWANTATGTVTSVDVSGGTTGLTTSGGPVTGSGTITIAGTLAVANGGTGATDAATARSNLSAAASGANGDITSLGGLTTPLSVAQGGSGASTLTGYLVGNGASAFTASATIPGGDIAGDISGNAANVTGTVAIANGGTGQTTQTAAFDALSPTTTKGDLIVDNGTNAIRLAVGTDDQVLVADSAVAAGVKWAAAGTGDVVGPAASTDNAITRYDGTTGKLVQDSNVSVSDGGSVNIPSGQSYMINSAALDQDDIGDGATYKQYNPASVAITGGTINNASVGAATASTGRFTTIESTVATGTAPLTVASTTLVTNLNADLLDGQSGSYYNDLANAIITSQSQGDILYFNGTSWARLPAGTNGQFLQTQGTGANPQWANTSGGGANTALSNLASVAINSALLPGTDDSIDLGDGTHEFRDAYIDGTANIDSLVADTADVNGGTIDGTTIGQTTPDIGRFTRSEIDDANHYIDSSGNDMTFTDQTVSAVKLSETTGWLGSVTRIKVLPSDFQSDDNDDNLAMYADGSYTRASSGTTQAVVNIPIPTGFRATHVRVYGSDATNAVNVYANDIANGTTATGLGSGSVGTEINITDLDSTTTNYLSIYVGTGNGDRIYGGYVTISKI